MDICYAWLRAIYFQNVLTLLSVRENKTFAKNIQSPFNYKLIESRKMLLVDTPYAFFISDYFSTWSCTWLFFQIGLNNTFTWAKDEVNAFTGRNNSFESTRSTLECDWTHKILWLALDRQSIQRIKENFYYLFSSMCVFQKNSIPNIEHIFLNDRNFWCHTHHQQ